MLSLLLPSSTRFVISTEKPRKCHFLVLCGREIRSRRIILAFTCSTSSDNSTECACNINVYTRTVAAHSLVRSLVHSSVWRCQTNFSLFIDLFSQRRKACTLSNAFWTISRGNIFSLFFLLVGFNFYLDKSFYFFLCKIFFPLLCFSSTDKMFDVVEFVLCAFSLSLSVALPSETETKICREF